MLSKIIAKLTNNLVKDAIIEDSDRTIYAFGIRQGVIILINLITVFILGHIFNQTLNLLAFSVSYLSLRAYAGGYHAETEFRCYLVSTAMLLLVVFIMKMVTISPYAFMITLCFSLTSLILLSPVENPHKPLDALEKKVYRHKTFKVMTVQLLVMGISYFIMMGLFKIIVISFGMIAVILHLGCFKNRVYFLLENY